MAKVSIAHFEQHKMVIAAIARALITHIPFPSVRTTAAAHKVSDKAKCRISDRDRFTHGIPLETEIVNFPELNPKFNSIRLRISL